MDVESSPAPLTPKPRRGRPPTRCCTACVALLGLFVIILVILSLTRYKARHPSTTVDSIALRSLEFSLFTRKLNLTLDLSLSIHNPNRVGFKYSNSTALLNFDGQLIGQVPVPAGNLGGRDTEDLNLTLTVFADRLLTDNQALRDVIAGSLPLNTYMRITGKVRVFHFIKFHVQSTSSCNFDIFVLNNTISDQQCSYKTKF